MSEITYNLTMELEFARNLTKLDRLSPNLQGLLFNLKDDVVNYYLASREDLLSSIQEVLVTERKFLEQWAKGANRDQDLISKVLANHPYEEVAHALVNQKYLSCVNIEYLLKYENWLIAWRLLQEHTLCQRHQAVALRLVIASISSTSNEKLQDEIVEYLKEEKELWSIVLGLTNIDQLYILTKFPSLLLPFLQTEFEGAVNNILGEWKSLTYESHHWKNREESTITSGNSKKFSVDLSNVTASKIKVLYERLLYLVLGNLNHTNQLMNNIEKSELSLPYLQEIKQWGLLKKVKEKISSDPKDDNQIAYLHAVERYPYFKGNDLFVSKIAITQKEKITPELYILATTITTTELLDELVLQLLASNDFKSLVKLVERFPETKVKSVGFLEYLIDSNSILLLEENIFEGFEEYLINKVEDLSSLIENEILLDRILICIENEDELVSKTMFDLLPEWVCSLNGLRDFSREITN